MCIFFCLNKILKKKEKCSINYMCSFDGGRENIENNRKK